MRPTLSRQADYAAACLSSNEVLRDAGRAARCAAWAQAEKLGRLEGPQVVYRPTTSALWSFRGHPSLPPPPGHRYDFLRDAADPHSLATLEGEEIYALYQAAADGLLLGAFAPEVPWRLRPHAVALLEPYRRLTASFEAGDHPVFTSAMQQAEEEVRMWTERSWPRAAQRSWQKRERRLFAALASVETGFCVARPRAAFDERVMREVTNYLLAAACAIGVLCALNDEHPRQNASSHYLGLACVMLCLAASIAMTTRRLQVAALAATDCKQLSSIGKL